MQDERGDIISSWLVQLLMLMAVVGLVGYEFLTLSITSLTLDGDAKQVVDAAADAYERDQDEDDALAAAQQEAEERGAEVIDMTVEEDDVIEVTVTKPTGTLIVHRVPGLDNLDEVAMTRRSRWDP